LAKKEIVMTADEFDTKQMWKSISSALGTEMREAMSILGLSGQDHPVQAIAVDDKTKRVVIFSAEPNPRIAALMQVDVQATLPDVHVLVARPVMFDLSDLARRIVNQLGDIQALVPFFESTDEERKKKIGTEVGHVLKPLFDTASKVRLPVSVQLMDVIQQLISLDWGSITTPLAMKDVLAILFSTTTLDSAAADRRLGICPIPLYDFSEADYDLLLSGKHIDEVQARLKRLGIYQYFFPAPDQLLLGLADNRVTKYGSHVLAAEEAPAHGHPLGAPELFNSTANLLETLEELKGTGYAADTEIGLDITETGRSIRQNIKIRPREGLINKLSKILSIKVDFSSKDLLK
jgi:hypothetical protein